MDLRGRGCCFNHGFNMRDVVGGAHAPQARASLWCIQLTDATLDPGRQKTFTPVD